MALLIGGLAVIPAGRAQISAIERLVMPGPVVAAHAEYEDQCASCHVRFSRDSQTELCLDCHEEIAEDLRTETGFHSLSPEPAGLECAACHTDHDGREADIVGLDLETFDHDLTDFPLLGSHLEALCEDCHTPDLPFHEAQTECLSCHADDDQHRGNLGEACADCHSQTAWEEAQFDHEDATEYPLTGAHDDLTCSSCHIDEQYENTASQCVDCHLDDDDHMGNNGTECQDCHTTVEWADLLFDHFERTGFALTGGHSERMCADCHEGNKLEQQLSTECYDCHQEDDSHDGVNGEMCADCHQVTEWLDATFDHTRDAEFPLSGAHGELMCMDCHVAPVDERLPDTTCHGCHSEEDPHDGQLGESCASCHGEVLWTEDVRFDHDLTGFPLLGGHREADCEDCHETPAFLDAPEQCVDCHLEDDVHERRLGPDCAWCHNPGDWLLWRFDHAEQTRFLLDGAHENLDCLACHRVPVDAAIDLSMTCGSCHRTDDVHRGEFRADCVRCHTTESFSELTVVQ